MEENYFDFSLEISEKNLHEAINKCLNSMTLILHSLKEEKDKTQEIPRFLGRFWLNFLWIIENYFHETKPLNKIMNFDEIWNLMKFSLKETLEELNKEEHWILMILLEISNMEFLPNIQEKNLLIYWIDERMRYFYQKTIERTINKIFSSPNELKQAPFQSEDQNKMTIIKYLKLFHEILLSFSLRSFVMVSLKQKRFDKFQYGLEHTILIGENGGVYLLFNGFDDLKEFEIMDDCKNL